MKQPVKPKVFTSDKPLLPGFIYMIQQDKTRKVVSTESLKELTGHWIVKQTWKK